MNFLIVCLTKLFYVENQEFFERKRQLKGSSRTSAPKRFNDKTMGRGSQDLFSLEVIMSAHRKNINQRKGSLII